MLAEREVFKICFVCIFVCKSSKISPQEHVLKQHSCLSVPGKLRQKEYGCSGSKLAEKLRRIFIAGKRNHLVLTQSQSCCRQCRTFLSCCSLPQGCYMLLFLKWPLFPAKGQMGWEAQLWDGSLMGLVAEHLDWVPVRGSERCHCVL